ncbi:MAG: hypothetical protein L0H19_03375, partial [Salinisphaera sp.]|nr:hypothetical protein [Salinisphaera sp.]
MTKVLEKSRSQTLQPDTDPEETREWLDALEGVLQVAGGDRGQYLLQQLEERLRESERVPLLQPYSAYRNSIPLEDQGAYP